MNECAIDSSELRLTTDWKVAKQVASGPAQVHIVAVVSSAYL